MKNSKNESRTDEAKFNINKVRYGRLEMLKGGRPLTLGGPVLL